MFVYNSLQWSGTKSGISLMYVCVCVYMCDINNVLQGNW